MNATEAALRAGYSEKTAYSIGWENLRKPEIRDEIDKYLNERSMTADEVVSRLSDQARGVPADCFTAYGPTIAVDFEKMAERGLLHLVKRLSYDTNGNPQVEFYNAQTALVHLGKAHAMFTDNVQQSGEVVFKHDVSDNAREAILSHISRIADTRPARTDHKQSDD